MDAIEIKEKYKKLKHQSFVYTVVFVVLLVPRLTISFTEMETFFGMTKSEALIPQAVGLAIYCFFFFKIYKCPSCKKSPGNGWFVKKCASCGVELS